MREWVIWFLTFFAVVGANAHAENGWRKYSQKMVQELVQEEKHVFIKFDARWCLACVANDWVWDDPDIMAKFREKGVVLVHADMTKSNKEALDGIKLYGRRSLPTYVLIDGQTGEHRIIYYRLTKDSLLEILNDL